MLKRIISLLLIIIFATSLFGCGKGQTNNKNETESDSEVLSIFSYKPDTFCPIASCNEANIRMLAIVYDGLISLGDNYLPQPALAESWQASANNTEWTLNLRKNATWHDGGSLTADDVIYTVNQIKKMEGSSYHYNLSNVSEVVKVGDRSVKFILSKSVSNFINLLYFPIIKSGADEIDTVNYKPNGTGAYRLEDRNEGNIYYLVRSDSWWGGRAKAKTIEVRMLPGNDTALYAFGSGTIDMVPADNMDWGKFVDLKNVEYKHIATPVYTFLGINHKNPQLAMDEVRRAVSLAISRGEIISEARIGYGVAANSPMRPEWHLVGNQEFNLKQNTAAAKNLMEENGWEFKNNAYKKVADGVEYTASFSILINEDNTVRENVSRIISKNLETFGIKTDVVRVPFDEYTKRISEGNYDAFVGSMVLSPELDFSGMLGEGNIFAYSDSELQFVMDEMQSSKTPEAISNAYAEFINLFEQMNPVVGLFFENSVMLYSKQISDDVLPSYFDVYRGIESIEKMPK